MGLEKRVRSLLIATVLLPRPLYIKFMIMLKKCKEMLS